MEEIRVNRLPLLTYRYLHTNDTPLSFETPKGKGSFTFSDMTHVKEGGSLPEDFDGASKETVLAAGKAVTIPSPFRKGRASTSSSTYSRQLMRRLPSSSVWKRARPFPSHGNSRAETGKGPASLLRTMSLQRMQDSTYRAWKAVSPRPSSMTSVTAYSPLVPVPTSMRPSSAERRSLFIAMESSPAIIPR